MLSLAVLGAFRVLSEMGTKQFCCSERITCKLVWMPVRPLFCKENVLFARLGISGKWLTETQLKCTVVHKQSV